MTVLFEIPLGSLTFDVETDGVGLALSDLVLAHAPKSKCHRPVSLTVLYFILCYLLLLPVGALLMRPDAVDCQRILDQNNVVFQLSRVQGRALKEYFAIYQRHTVRKTRWVTK